MSRELDRVKKSMQDDEALYWSVIEVIQGLDTDFGDKVAVGSKDDAVRQAVYTVQQVLTALQEMGLDFTQMDPGHGIGHLVRDYVNALRLFRGSDYDPRHMFIGFCGAVLHDIGCAVIERYSEPTRAVRHAEASAILIAEAVGQLERMGRKMRTRTEWMLIRYAVAAHTMYMKESQVMCTDGVMRTIKPYADTHRHLGEVTPIHFVWFTRWPDRLECCGPSLIGRHYLTLIKPHREFSHDIGFYDVSYDHHMQAVLREVELRGQDRRGQTMLEHLDMYARSQTNESPYGKYDFGRMITLRDEHTEILNNVIEVVHQDYATERFKFWDRSRNEISEPGEAVLEAWTKHLADTIEPTKLGSIAATDLELKFRRHLTMDEQSPWLCGFYHAMQGYRSWYLGVEKDLEGVPSEWLELPGICDDVREIIAPKPSWVDLLDEVTSS